MSNYFKVPVKNINKDYLNGVYVMDKKDDILTEPIEIIYKDCHVIMYCDCIECKKKAIEG